MAGTEIPVGLPKYLNSYYLFLSLLFSDFVFSNRFMLVRVTVDPEPILGTL